MGKGGKAAEEMGEKDGLAGSGETPKQKQRKYKKVSRSEEKGVVNGVKVSVGVKRNGDEMEVEEGGKQKKGKVGDVIMSDVVNEENIVKAGLSEQSCRTQ
jgi:hypothetical protein